MATTKLFEPLSFAHGPAMKNRFMLAPLTNCQSHPDGRLSDEEFHWLTMRAKGDFALTMTCAAHVQARGQGFPGQLGIFGDQHLEGLTRLAGAIKTAGSLAAVQLHHAGNRSPKDIVGEAVCPSDDPASGARGLILAEVEQLRDDFIAAAKRAERAGFDGVEIHGANGYLLDQFAKDGTNKRTDAYGGSIENRAKLMLEVAKVVTAEAGPERTGIRISPVTPANDVSDSNPQPLFDYIVDHLNALKLVYIHVIEGATGGPRDIAPFDYGSLRKRFNGGYVANNGYDFELATKMLAADAADLIAFGKPYIANPDLVERLKRGAPLNAPDKATFYGGGAKGYTDYPALDAALDAAQ